MRERGRKKPLSPPSFARSLNPPLFKKRKKKKKKNNPKTSPFMLVGAKHGGVTVGEVESAHAAEVGALIEELSAAGAADMGISLDDGVVTRLAAYARAVSHFPTAVKEFEWRNGYFWGLSQAAVAAGKPDPCPAHSALLKEVGAV
jgi:hypothetical protein